MRVCGDLRFRAFTLLELLIVVAAIVIIAALTDPSVMHSAPERSKVSRVRADMRSIATALESYYQDHNTYPASRPLALSPTCKHPDRLKKAGGAALNTIQEGTQQLPGLTTPVAYLTSLFPDPFAPERGMPFAYYVDANGWILISPGPDLDYDIKNPQLVYDSRNANPSAQLYLLAYDPTNGTVSDGDLWRVKQ